MSEYGKPHENPDEHGPIHETSLTDKLGALGSRALLGMKAVVIGRQVERTVSIVDNGMGNGGLLAYGDNYKLVGDPAIDMIVGNNSTVVENPNKGWTRSPEQ